MNTESVASESGTSKSSAKIAESIRKEILTGRLLPEDPLPPERDLARRYGVHRGAVREAMSILQHTRFIKSTPRGRTRVCDIWKEGSIEMLQYLFDPEPLPDAPASWLDETMILWRFCYASIAEQAAASATEEDGSRLDSIAKGFPDPAEDPEGYLSRDLLFLEALADASRTTVLRWLFNAIRPAVEQISSLLVPHMSETVDRGFHLDLARAVSRCDEAAARDIAIRNSGLIDHGIGELTKIDKANSRPSEASSKEPPPSSKEEKPGPGRPETPEKSKIPHSPLNHFVWMKTPSGK